MVQIEWNRAYNFGNAFMLIFFFLSPRISKVKFFNQEKKSVLGKLSLWVTWVDSLTVWAELLKCFSILQSCK